MLLICHWLALGCWSVGSALLMAYFEMWSETGRRIKSKNKLASNDDAPSRGKSWCHAKDSIAIAIGNLQLADGAHQEIRVVGWYDETTKKPSTPDANSDVFLVSTNSIFSSLLSFSVYQTTNLFHIWSISSTFPIINLRPFGCSRPILKICEFLQNS